MWCKIREDANASFPNPTKMRTYMLEEYRGQILEMSLKSTEGGYKIYQMISGDWWCFPLSWVIDLSNGYENVEPHEVTP